MHIKPQIKVPHPPPPLAEPWCVGGRRGHVCIGDRRVSARRMVAVRTVFYPIEQEQCGHPRGKYEQYARHVHSAGMHTTDVHSASRVTIWPTTHISKQAYIYIRSQACTYTIASVLSCLSHIWRQDMRAHALSFSDNLCTKC